VVLSVALVALATSTLLGPARSTVPPVRLSVTPPDDVLAGLDAALESIGARRAEAADQSQAQALEMEERHARLVAVVELNHARMAATEEVEREELRGQMASILTPAFDTQMDLIDTIRSPEIMAMAASDPEFGIKATYLSLSDVVGIIHADTGLKTHIEETEARLVEIDTQLKELEALQLATEAAVTTLRDLERLNVDLMQRDVERCLEEAEERKNQDAEHRSPESGQP
jgi:hypothetical protein